MKIRKLQLKNIGVFDDETIDFQPCPVKDKAEIHIFTGQNGSGKTTLLMVLASVFSRIEIRNDKGRMVEIKDGVMNYVIPQPPNFIAKRFLDIEGKKEGNSNLLVTFSDGSESEIQTNAEQKLLYFSKRSDKITKYIQTAKKLTDQETFDFAVFAFSGYRKLKAERVEAIKEPNDFNPLFQSLEFLKDYDQSNQLTVNQLITNNFSKKWIESSRNPRKSEKFAKVLSSIEQAIFDITGWKMEFDLQTEPINLITKINGEELDFDVLPDGLRSLISWIADLLGRVDLLKWRDDLPIFEKNLILFLDEIEVHLHPAWQRKVLPVVQKLFKNSQIFVSTHSPFVVNSVDDAWIYKLELENGKAKVAEIIKSEDGFSYSHVLSEIFDIEEEFGVGVQKDLAKFKELRNKILSTKNGSDKTQKELLRLAKSLAVQSEELQTIVQFELRQLSKRTGKNLAI
jgi:predicted ATP-binding protein involved in virulence